MIIYTKENGRQELTEDEWDEFHVSKLTFHREDGPAIENGNDMRWYLDDNLHRIDGPAWENILDTREHSRGYYIEGQGLSFEDFNKTIQEVKDMSEVLRLIDPRKWVREFK